MIDIKRPEYFLLSAFVLSWISVLDGACPGGPGDGFGECGWDVQIALILVLVLGFLIIVYFRRPRRDGNMNFAIVIQEMIRQELAAPFRTAGLSIQYEALGLIGDIMGCAIRCIASAESMNVGANGGDHHDDDNGLPDTEVISLREAARSETPSPWIHVGGWCPPRIPARTMSSQQVWPSSSWRSFGGVTTSDFAACVHPFEECKSHHMLRMIICMFVVFDAPFKLSMTRRFLMNGIDINEHHAAGAHCALYIARVVLELTTVGTWCNWLKKQAGVKKWVKTEFPI